jgi:hypothetical protein
LGAGQGVIHRRESLAGSALALGFSTDEGETKAQAFATPRSVDVALDGWEEFDRPQGGGGAIRGVGSGGVSGHAA